MSTHTLTRGTYVTVTITGMVCGMGRGQVRIATPAGHGVAVVLEALTITGTVGMGQTVTATLAGIVNGGGPRHTEVVYAAHGTLYPVNIRTGDPAAVITPAAA